MPTLPSIGGNSGYMTALGGAQSSYANTLAGYNGGGGGSNNLAPGGLPFGALSNGGNFDFSGNPSSLSSNYKQAYQGALGFNSQLGNEINQGFGQLGSNIQGTIAGITSSQQQAINDQYAQQSGQATQGLINSGLGNSTVMSSVQRGIGLDQAKASNNLANQMAGLSAGYQSQTGLAQLGYLNSVSAPYPNAQMYGQLAQQYGAAQQANANRQQAADQFSQLLAASKRTIGSGAGGGTGVATGYMPQQTPGMFAPGTGTSVGMPNGLTGGYAQQQQPGGGGGLGAYGNLALNTMIGVNGGWQGASGGDGLAAVTGYPALQGGGAQGDYYDPTGQWAGAPSGGGYGDLGNLGSSDLSYGDYA